MSPEEKARLEIDRKLEDIGWEVIDREDFSPSVAALAVREGLLKGHKEADYLLFLEGKAIGVLEAKKADTRLSDVVAAQAEDYTYQLLDWYQSGSNVVISTIQRLFATLTGQEFEDEDEFEGIQDVVETQLIASLPDQPFLPPDFFDYIIVDECHRSIYGRWQQVLKYFSNARIIGLTATPTPETQAFEAYIKTHRDEMEALRIIYNNQNEPITYYILQDLKEKLFAVDSRFNMLRLWNSYAIVNMENVFQLKTITEREALTNLIQLIRYAFRIIPELKSLSSMAASRFELWCGQIQRPLTEGQKEIMKEIVGYIVANGTYTNEELREENITLFAQMVRSYGSAEVVDEVLESLCGFMLRVG